MSDLVVGSVVRQRSSQPGDGNAPRFGGICLADNDHVPLQLLGIFQGGRQEQPGSDGATQADGRGQAGNEGRGDAVHPPTRCRRPRGTRRFHDEWASSAQWLLLRERGPFVLGAYEDVRGQHAQLLATSAFQGYDARGPKGSDRLRRLWASAFYPHSLRRPKDLGQPVQTSWPIP